MDIYNYLILYYHGYYRIEYQYITSHEVNKMRGVGKQNERF